MNRKTKIIISLGGCLVAGLLYGTYYLKNNSVPQKQAVDLGNAPPYTQEEVEINRIWDTAETAEEKELATNKLITIVKDSQANILLRTEAIRKLGEVGALEAEDIAKDISDTSVWVSKAYDIMRELIWEEDTQVFNYRKPGVTTEKLAEMVVEQETDSSRKEDAKRKLENIGMKNLSLVHNSSCQNWVDMTYHFTAAANGTYHRLRYLRETDPEKKYQLLLDALKNGPDYWATEQLIINGEERALPDIIEKINYNRLGHEEEAEQSIKICKAKFVVVKAAKNDQTIYEKVMRGKYSFPYNDEDDVRESVEMWAAGIAGFETGELIIDGEEKYQKIKNPSKKDNPDQKNK